MKNIYSLRHLMAFFSFFYCFSVNLFAQTAPPAQTLPYSQLFDPFPSTVVEYPVGFQGWLVATTTGKTFNTNGILISDKALTAGGSASSASGNIYNFENKIGFLNTGSADFAIGFAFITTGQKAIKVKYDIMTIRNPYGTGTGTTLPSRINEMVLQYRVGTTGVFTSLLPTAYRNNTVGQIDKGVVIPQNLKSIEVILPEECNDKSIVQIRWISREDSGSGTRPSFAISNINIQQDLFPPVNSVDYPKIDNVLSDEFDFHNKIDEVGKTYYVLVATTDAAPTPAQIKGGLNASGTVALQSGVLDIADEALVYSKTIVGLALNTAYSVYSISEDPYGNIQATANKIDVTTSAVVSPKITTTITAIDLGTEEENFSSSALDYKIEGANLINPVTVTATANFAVSKDNITFGPSVVYDLGAFASNATPTVYVRFTPNGLGSFTGQITHQSTNAATKIVTVSGFGINPYVQNFNDANVFTNSGWTSYSVAGVANQWKSTTTNANSAPGAVVMNGFSDGGVSEDWLISPKLRLNSFNNYPLLSFYSRKYFAGPSLKLMVSTNYDGKSSPDTASWTEIDGNFPVTTGTYVQSQYINLGAYITDHTYVAWVYETLSGGSGNASEWTIDDVAITNELGFVDSNPNLDFGDVSPNAVSTSKSFIFKAGGYGDVTIAAPLDYQLSLNDSNFLSSVTVSEADALLGKTIYARFTPSTKELSITGTLTLTGTSLNKNIGTLKGSSLPKADTFDVVTYNLEFFGTDIKDKSGKEFGPTDNALQIANVAKAMIKLDADVYAVQEVSDDKAMEELIKQISVGGKTFDKVTSPSWSYSFNEADPNFPAQKLVVIYNTQIATVTSQRVMFKEFYDDLRAGTETLVNYPGTNANFFSSGRLPYMVQIKTDIGGVKRLINLVNLHARANSGSDISKYNMRKYDAQVLKDSLDRYYANSDLIILGDYNDDVKASVVTPNPSSYKMFVDDVANYNALTLDISKAGAFSFLSSGGFLDHIMISNELNSEYIPNSIAVYDPRSDINNYVNTTSDHGPVIARFELKKSTLGTIDFETKNGFAVKTYPNPATDIVNVLVKTNDDKKLKLRLYDITGRMIGKPVDVNGGTENSTSVIQISDLKSGIYIYTLSENNKVVFKDKIIKK
ncbi:T9SS-dependent choice-of-anchor J family protein [Flavobacterium sp. 140616W15]|uniref:T9SS-dependent choice-of-anchor J family protein n=1 Tax=Flavobacterium sp. 140616W15 TaxID=2478552 RepID=UPI000F0CA553|nr:choice-of-anchor J domain-containing protein [Flavobacterium sp. 140616W15]AYN04995.1 T9SS C-terminal target domain-containing protein [Flavobacterium sp. 140616W15]